MKVRCGGGVLRTLRETKSTKGRDNGSLMGERVEWSEQSRGGGGVGRSGLCVCMTERNIPFRLQSTSEKFVDSDVDTTTADDNHQERERVVVVVVG